MAPPALVAGCGAAPGIVARRRASGALPVIRRIRVFLSKFENLSFRSL
jgi:hypothetical protein